MKSYDLDCVYDARKSFYSKARVEEHGNNLRLYSYSTLVAFINRDKNKVKVYGTYSDTTLRHIKEFLKQNGFKADTLKQITEDYMNGEKEDE